MIGIYKIESIIKPERVYIGSALDINHRWKCHKSRLRYNKHHSLIMQNHFNKYGEDDLIFTVIEECLPEYLLNKEQHYMDELNPYFNVCKEAGRNGINNKGKHPSLEVREKLRKASLRNGNRPPNMKGIKHSPEHIAKQIASRLKTVYANKPILSEEEQLLRRRKYFREYKRRYRLKLKNVA